MSSHWEGEGAIELLALEEGLDELKRDVGTV
jgi:hypothetical protein